MFHEKRHEQFSFHTSNIHLLKMIYPTMANCAKMMTGTPYLNFLCIVLWCQTFMPNHAPMLPPITAIINNVDSGMRHLERFAFHLSIPYVKNVITLMSSRYIRKTFIIYTSILTFPFIIYKLLRCMTHHMNPKNSLSPSFFLKSSEVKP